MEKEIKTEWEKCISEETGDQAVCLHCKEISEAKNPGEHILCEKCKQFIWREKWKL